MNDYKFWSVVLAAILVLPNVAASADPATDALEKGNGCMEKRDFDSAIAAFTEAIRLDPNKADSYFGRGVAYGCKGEIEKEISDETEAIRLNPKLDLAYYNRGWAYGQKGECDKENADYTKAISLDPKFAQAYYSRAIAYEKKGDNAKAEKDFGQAEKLGYKGRPVTTKPGDVLGNTWVTVLLILGAATCSLLYWIVRRRRLLAYSNKGDKAKAEEDFDQSKTLGHKAR